MNHRSLLIDCLATLGLDVAGWGQADGKICIPRGRGVRGRVDYECRWERPRQPNPRSAWELR